MNTHPTHTRVWVGWGLWPLIVPIGVDVFLLLFALFPPHLGEWVCFFRCIRVFFVLFGAVVCVWKVFFVLSNIVNYRKNYIHLQIATLKTPVQSW